jgi:penicillin amidase
MDFFQEKIEGDQVLSKGNWVPLKKTSIVIKVKDGEDVNIEIPITPHGPVINGAFDGMSEKDSPISMSWTYTMFENKTMDGFYEMNNATDMKKFEAALSKIHAPGLSVNYGDAEGNIAWWACAQLVKRAQQVNSWSLLDGSSGNDDWLGYYTFAENPRNINPPSGFIYSANNWPEMKHYPTKNQLDTSYMWYPGYYKPEYRGERISKLLSETSDFTLESMKSVMTDITSDADIKVMDEFFNIVDDSLDLNNHSEYAQYQYRDIIATDFDTCQCGHAVLCVVCRNPLVCINSHTDRNTLDCDEYIN